MKGTLYSSDFVKNSLGEFKLLELNTDTDFPSASLEHFNWSPLIEELNSSSIDTIHVIYKNFQSYLKTNLSESIASSGYSISWEETLENTETIYPTDVQDSPSKFVLRMAYNEAAILDSDYCKNGINLYKLYSDYTASSDIIPHYVSSSNDDYVNDTLDRTTNIGTIPDYVKKGGIFTPSAHLDFYKLGSSSIDSTVRFDDMITSDYSDGDIISTYYDTSGDGNYVQSYRSCNILYGSQLTYINIGTYKISSWLELPTTNLVIDDDVLVNKIANKHRYEFASNWPKEYWKNQSGVSAESILTPETGSPEYAKDTVVGKKYLSFDIPGLPDVDDYNTISSWSLDGNTLPVGTSITSSTLVSKQSHSVDYGVLTEISCSDDSSLFIGSALPLLVYDVDQDKIRFEYGYNLLTGSFQLFNSSGSRIDIVENNIAIFENEEYTYELNMESDDTFLVNNSGVYLIAHNPYYAGTCFLAGTVIQTAVGPKSIEDILVGDVVSVWDEENNTFSYGDVTAIDHRHTVGDHLEGCIYAGFNQPGVFKISIDMGSEEGPNDTGIRFTPEHPFLTKEGWKALAPIPSQEPWATQQTELKILEKGDFIKFSDKPEGTWYEIKDIEFEPMPSETKVYNFTVDNFHNYVAHSVVVHNK